MSQGNPTRPRAGGYSLIGRRRTFLAFSGSLLSLSGDKRVGFLARDVDKVEVGVGRVLPDQLQHLASQMWDYSKPLRRRHRVIRSWSGLDTVRDYSGRQPGKPNYDSIDLGQYLVDKTQTRRGLFLLHLRSVSGNRRRAPAADGEEEDADSDGGDGQPDQPQIVEDSRLVLVTDLGFMVKLASDGTRDVFVQSIHSGEPVAGARVEVLGNLQRSARYGRDNRRRRSHVQFAKFGDLRREKVPLMVVVQKDSDYSFMPLRSNRSLEMSRFDIGGVVNATSAQQLTAYLFTDRGIYRPGETTHLGLISRTGK